MNIDLNDPRRGSTLQNDHFMSPVTFIKAVINFERFLTLSLLAKTVFWIPVEPPKDLKIFKMVCPKGQKGQKNHC